MEEEETNMAAILKLLKELKKDMKSLKDQNQQCRSRQHSCCEAGEDHSGQNETFQANRIQRLYSYQGRDDLGLNLTKYFKV